MSRVTCSVASKSRRKSLFKAVSGFWGDRKNNKRQSRSALMKAKANQYVGRKNRKRFFRSLWITRIAVAAKIGGVSYSTFMGSLKKMGVTLNRKVLADMAFEGDGAFGLLVSQVLQHTRV